jgi:hypothetical protein
VARSRVSRPLLATMLVLGIVSGCGRPSVPGPRQAASDFEKAVQARHGDSACRALAPSTKSELRQSEGTPCPTGVLKLHLPTAGSVQHVQVFGTMALVRFTRDTMFVSRFHHGWRVLAAGCRSVPGHPYDCDLQGG